MPKKLVGSRLLFHQYRQTSRQNNTLYTAHPSIVFVFLLFRGHCQLCEPERQHRPVTLQLLLFKLPFKNYGERVSHRTVLPCFEV